MNGILKSRLSGRSIVFLAAATCGGNAAYAQGLGADGPPDAAGSRPQPAYDALGIIAGDFMVYPTFGIASSVDTNVFRRSSSQEADLSATFTPTLTIRNMDPDRVLSLSADGRFRRYAELRRQDDDQYNVDVSGRYEFGGDTLLTTRAGWSRATVSRGTFENDLQVGGPLQKNGVTADISAQRRFNRLTARAAVSGEKFAFDDVQLDDGTRIDQSFRSGRRLGASLGFSYQMSARIAAQVQGRVDRFDYDDDRPLSYRDAKGYSVTAGARYEVTRLLLLELGAGVRRHAFENPLFEDISGLALSGRVRWYPSPLLSVRLDLSQTTSTSSSALVSAVNATSASLESDYELKRNLLLSASVKVSHEDYGRLGSTSNLVSVGGRAAWKLNRWLRITPSLAYEMRRGSSAASSSFDAFRFGLAVTLAR